ncbi:MAG: YlmC/YmxH family sporulation protein [Candidatus Carbobacillus sp.]|nr:YlmC/YmxH family sporulation protein [Candidatus Carbobacillus sp.]
MRFSEMAGKEVVDLTSGERLGMIHESDLLVDPASGRIGAIVLPLKGGWFRRTQGEVAIPWEAIQTIGTDLIIVSLKDSRYGVMES